MIRNALIAVATALVGVTALAQTTEFAATVNGEGIGRTRLQASVDAMLQRQGTNYGAITDPRRFKQLQRQVLDQLVAQQLLWQEAKRKEIVIDDQEVADAVKRVKEQFPSEQDFRNRIQSGGFTEETYTEDLKRRLSVRRMIDRDIAAGIRISDQEVDDYYDANPEQMKRPEEVRARHVLIKLDPDADEAADKAAHQKIEKVLAEAKAGGDFVELAKQHSEGPSAPQGGDLGFFGRGRMVPEFEEAAFALQPGQVSDAVRTRFGYHVIRVEERRGGDTVAKAEIAERIRAHLQSEKVQDELQALVDRLRAQGKVEILIPE